MDMFLTRKASNVDGIYGEMVSADGNFKCATLEHAYRDLDGSFIPKVAPGTYECERHPPVRLPYETFMLRDVPNFQGSPVNGILIHIGNFNNDSIGCILLGAEVMKFVGGVTDSKMTFNAFMLLQKGVSTFNLTVK